MAEREQQGRNYEEKSMKQNWTYKKLGEVVAITMGQSPASDTYNESEGLPFFQGNADFGKEHPSVRIYCNSPIRIADSGDILISVRAPIGAINIADRKCCIGRGLAAIRGNDNYMSRFIYYLLMASKEKLVSQGTGSTFKSIGKDVLYNMLIPVPPLSIQSRIVSELDLLQSLIDKQKAQLKEYDTLAQSIFYDMFGDPVENEKGWEVKKLGEVGELQRGSGLSKKDLIPSGYPCILYGQIHTKFGAFTTKHIACIPPDLIKKAKIAHTGDVIMAITSEDVEGSCKSVAWMGDYDIAIGSDAAIYHHTMNGIYVSYYTQTKAFYNEKAKYAKGFKVTHISTKEIASISIPVPPLSLQQSFAAKIESIERQKELINQSIREARALFDSRMEYYFGE